MSKYCQYYERFGRSSFDEAGHGAKIVWQMIRTDQNGDVNVSVEFYTRESIAPSPGFLIDHRACRLEIRFNVDSVQTVFQLEFLL